jgi:purine-cytosine permease-like protein
MNTNPTSHTQSPADTSPELDDMRRQMSLLHDKLDKQSIVNEQLLRRAMSGQYDWIERSEKQWLIIGIIAIPFCIWLFAGIAGLSTAFIIFSIVYFLLTVALLWKSRNILKTRSFLSDDLRSVAGRILRKRRLDRMVKYTRWPLCAAWLIWFYVETLFPMASFNPTPAGIGGIVGALAGILLGIRYMRHYNRTLSDLEQQIKEFEQEG